MRNRRLTWLSTLSLLFLCSFAVQAQDVYTSSGRTVKQADKARKAKEKTFDPSRIIFGGGIGLGFGSVTSIGVSPVLGYRFTDKFAAGISIGYQYLRIRDYFRMPNNTTIPATYEYYPYKSSIYSGGVWGRYVIWNNIFAHAEYEHNFLSFREYRMEWSEDARTNVTVSSNVLYNAPSLLLGGGFRQPINDRISLVLVALYDVLQRDYSPYKNRIDLRIGVNVGF